RINLIISEFLVLAKPQAPQIKEYDLRKLIGNLSLLFSSEFNLKGIVFTEHWSDESDFVLSGEENSIKQVLINLLKNAVESLSPEGHIRLAVSRNVPGMVSVTISDDGSGISEESLKRIYEPFFTTKENGTGLGLLISQKIIQDHGGSLTISSKAGEGTQVEILLPET